MLLKKRYGRPLSALSLSLALAFAPLFNVQAAEPEVVPGDSSATPGELSVALTQSDGQSPAVAKLAGEQPLSMATAAKAALAVGTDQADFMQTKLVTARFYAERIMPDTGALRRKLENGSESLMALTPDQFLPA